MACVTLKRLRENDALNHRLIKRRRRFAFGMMDSSMASTDDENVRGDEAKPSAFAKMFVSKLEPNKLEQNIRSQMQTLKLKQLNTINSNENMQECDPNVCQMTIDNNCNSSIRTQDKVLLNLKQVQHICRRMLQEQENKIREEYDAVLTTKLAEQYDAFVKFTFDQIQRRYEATPTYLS